MRYQSTPGTSDGVMPTAEWFAVLREGMGTLGTVLDVGSAEGVMSVAALHAGAERITGISLPDDGYIEKAEVYKRVHEFDEHELIRLTFIPMFAKDWTEPRDTILFSMIAHWLGQAETARFARLARRHFAVIFREANDGYAESNGTWFPTLDELDVTVGGTRVLYKPLLEQDHGKTISAAVYRMDWLHKPSPNFDPRGLGALIAAGAPLHGLPAPDGYVVKLAKGLDLHGDPPFQPEHDKPVRKLHGREADALRDLIRGIAGAALRSGWYPTDLSPRNIIVGETAELVDLDEIEPTDGRVDERYLPIWQATLSAIDVAFTGDLRELV